MPQISGNEPILGLNKLCDVPHTTENDMTFTIHLE
jgi:hypothetical protein